MRPLRWFRSWVGVPSSTPPVPPWRQPASCGVDLRQSLPPVNPPVTTNSRDFAQCDPMLTLSATEGSRWPPTRTTWTTQMGRKCHLRWSRHACAAQGRCRPMAGPTRRRAASGECLVNPGHERDLHAGPEGCADEPARSAAHPREPTLRQTIPPPRHHGLAQSTPATWHGPCALSDGGVPKGEPRTGSQTIPGMRRHLHLICGLAR